MIRGGASWANDDTGTWLESGDANHVSLAEVIAWQQLTVAAGPAFAVASGRQQLDWAQAFEAE